MLVPGLHLFVCAAKGQLRVSLRHVIQDEFWGILKTM